MDSIIEHQSAPTISICPRPRDWRGSGRYIGHKFSTGYHPIGPIVFRPPGIAMQAIGEGQLSPLLECAFDKDIFESLTGEQSWNAENLGRCLNIREPRIGFAMRNIAAELSAPGFSYELVIEALGKVVMFDLARSLGVRQSASGGGRLASWQVRRVEDALQTALYAWPSLVDLAALCGISEGHFSRGFHATTGLTLQKYAEEIRINRAIRMLSGDLLAKEVAARLGFATQSAFCVAFKRKTGETVQQFRARLH